LRRNTNAIVLVGTQVVAQIDIKGTNGDTLFVRGVVGVVVKAPLDESHSYRVRFMDGTEIAMKRSDFAIRTDYTNLAEPDEHLQDYNLFDHVIYQCVVGSRAYGLDTENSDTDRRGIYLPPADLHWSIYGVPEQIESPATEETYWELQKFLYLALKANPNILECLYSPLVEHIDPIAQALLEKREIFLSKLIYQTYSGYVTSQFRQLQRHLRLHGEIRWKHVMHLIRLLLSGITAFQERYIPVKVEGYRDELLAIKAGQMTWETVDEWRIRLQKEFDKAFEQSNLPERPDYEQANLFLVKARRSMT
jgi:uncharacterized protein